MIWGAMDMQQKFFNDFTRQANSPASQIQSMHPEKTAEISSLLSRLENRIESVIDNTSALKSRIDLVLSPGDAGQGVMNDTAPQASLTMLGVRLEALLNRIEYLDYSINDISSRVEL